MALGILGKQIELNPELEALRNKGLLEHSTEQRQTEDVVTHLIEKTSRIHAAFLFEDEPTLQKLCLLICEAQDKIEDHGWQRLGYHLGISVNVLKFLNHHNITRQDPAHDTLLAYVQFQDATIGKIIEALKCMGRLDVITRTAHQINELADKVLQNHGNGNTSVYNIDRTSDYGSQEQSTISIELRDEIIRPAVVPPAPLVLRKLDGEVSPVGNNGSANNGFIGGERKEMPCTISPFTRIDMPRVHEIMVSRGVKDPTNHVVKSITPTARKEYSIKILLTFASDGEKYVDGICRELRRERENFKRIGVVVLKEHQEIVRQNPQQFITGAFYQVDYVCPIITEKYLNKVLHKKKNIFLNNLNTDTDFVNYIFTLMNNYYIANGCLNDKIRCIIPNNLAETVQKHLLMCGPIFSSWVLSDEVNDLAEKLLKTKK